METEMLIDYVKKFFPVTPTKDVAKHLNLSIHQVRTIARKNNILKCPTYKQQLKDQLVLNRKKWYENNVPNFHPSHFQEQIILGSLLGDAYISAGAERSINCYYQEHFGESQRAYRKWKLAHLKDLSFSINGNFLRSASLPYFKELRSSLYPNGIKTLDKEFLSKCTHPIFLTTLYLDDGSLTISYKYNRKQNTVYCHPSIILYTLNFTRSENELLANHLNNVFGTNFVVSGHPDGHQALLKVNKVEEVQHLLKVISLYTEEIPSMKYKMSLEENIKLKTESMQNQYGHDVAIKVSSPTRNRRYSQEEIQFIIQAKNKQVSDQEIADELGRTYWSIVYKVRELRSNHQL